MNFLFVFIALITLAGTLAYFGTPRLIATVLAAVGLLLVGQFASGSWASSLMIAAWITWAVLSALNFQGLRRRFLIEPALRLFKREMPTISPTERDALDAGTVWFDAELFSGVPNWQRLLALPKATLSKHEQAFLDGPVETLCEMVTEWEVHHELGDIPATAWQFLKEEGFLGIIIPKEYGGLGFSAWAHSCIVTKLASRCSTAAVNVMVPNSLGPAELLLRYGTEEQRGYYLPRLARGQEVPCFALTNPLAGSDAAAIPDFGIVCKREREGQEVLGISVTWEKRYITLGPVATLLGLAFHLYDPDGLLGGEPDVGITLALLPSDHPGVEIGRRHLPGGQAIQNGPNAGRDVFIPIEWVIGGQARCGDGWRMLMNCLAAGRSISLPASSTAALKLCARTAGAYARVRSQFGIPIGKFEGVQEALARIAANTYAVDAAREITAGALDRGEEPAVISAILKYQSTERMRASLKDAMDIHGGRAVCDGPANYLLGAYRAAPVAITVEGANILTRSLIIFGQGAIRCHPWLLKEIAAVEEDNEARGIEAFDHALMGHIGWTARNAARALFANLTSGWIGSDPSVGEVNYWYAQLERASASFALLADVALAQLGGALKRKESLSGRFADILGELYLLSATLKRFEDDGRPERDLPVVEYVFHAGLFAIQARFHEILLNLPSRSISWLLRRIVFPWGRRTKPVSDRLNARVAELLVGSVEFRAALARGMYFNERAEDPVGCLEHAVRLVENSAAAASKLRTAIKEARLHGYGDDVIATAESAGVLDAAEAEMLRQTQVAVRRAIDVDDFETTELWGRVSQDHPVSDAA